MQFKLVTEGRYRDFEAHVQHALESGFEPLGNMTYGCCCTSTGYVNETWSMAMIKYTVQEKFDNSIAKLAEEGAFSKY